MKAVIVSIKPEWVEKIARGQKTIEVRKTAPKGTPFKAYVYCTQGGEIVYGDSKIFVTDNLKHLRKSSTMEETFEKHSNLTRWNGRVIGEFICDKVDEYKFHEGLTEFNSMGLPSRTYGSYLIFADDYKSMCLSYDEVKTYGKGKTLYGWHISDLKIYDKPKELSEFRKCNFNSMNETAVCGNFHCKYYQDSGSYMIPPSCAKNGCRVTRPPQSWQFVEEL